jgi:hypothetical protein
MRILGINAGSALLASRGFERLPRAFREDADLALPAVRLGYAIVWGERVTTHPLASSADWHSRRAMPTMPCCAPSMGVVNPDELAQINARVESLLGQDHDEPHGGGGLRRVLVARLDSLGDVLLAGPAGRAVAASVQVTTRSRLGVSTLHSC